MHIQPVEPSQYDALGELTVAAYSALPGRPPSAAYRAVLRDVAARVAGAEVLVAVDDHGMLVGGVTYVSDPASDYAEFRDARQAGFRMLAVSPAAQGQGAGAALVRACISRARRDGKRELTLFTTDAMRPAQHLYERFGFRRAPEFDMIVEDSLQLISYVLTL